MKVGMTMRMVDLIEKKRNGQTLTEKEIQFIIQHYTSGEISDYQMSAFLMAIYFKDMTDEEIIAFTMNMARSGDIMDLSLIKGVKVDKHSTGGVGDTTTLILAPLVAACGVPVAKMSGRGLGHTGGTIDKLEAIPGFKVELSEKEFIQQVNTLNVAVIGQTKNLAPADKKLYALRDVTATVDSIPLIASSIMSKKIAAGADAIVLDVTIGEGAFMKNLQDARRLAHTMVRIGKLAHRQTMAVLSNMDEPLGFAIGNALEVYEAILSLKGKGPKDLMELVYTLGSQMLVVGKKAKTLKQARIVLEEKIASGEALRVFEKMVQTQKGDISYIKEPEKLLQAPYQTAIVAQKEGVIETIVASEMGIAAMLLGAGRKSKEETIDPSVGLMLHKKVGDSVKKGETLVTVYSRQKEITEVKELITKHILIGNKAPQKTFIYDVITE